MTSGRGTPGQAEIRVRPMLESDIEAVARIGSLSSQTPWTEVSVLTYFLREDTIFAVAEAGENGPLIGFAALLLAPPESDVLDIVVETACRGRGVGYALLDGICDLALIKGVDTIFLEVRPSNTPARRLYDKLGFTPIGVRKGYYTDPREDAVSMVRRRHIIPLHRE